MFEEFFKDIHIWQGFLAAGCIFMFLELCLPAFFLLWIGFACMLTAGTLFLCNVALVAQVVIFSVYCVLALVAGYFYYQRKSEHFVTSDLNNKEQRLVGKVFTLDHALHTAHSEANNKCYANLNDTRWLVQNNQDEEIAQNTKVRVVAVKDNTLIVEPV